MCGIFALISEDPDPDVYQYMTDGSKRGPDSTTYYTDRHCYMGFHRLAINGLNKKSGQPLFYKNYVLICNGEIFNYKDLIIKYRLSPTTQSDCEVIVLLYELMGIKCLNELDGEYSFVLYDTQHKTWTIARDPFGIRPLYLVKTNTQVCVSSDLGSMQAFDYADCDAFSPGHYAVFKNNKMSLTQFYTIHSPSKPVHSSLLYTRLCESIRKRVYNTDKPVACLLSGGLDSSLVAAIAARYYKEKTGKALETFSIGLKEAEDLLYSAKVATHIQSNHTQIICTEDEFFHSIPHVIRDIESYDTTTVRASVGNWLVGKYIREHSDAKVVLNGDGADEVMGGYLYFHLCPSPQAFDEECRRLLNDISFFDVLRSDRCISSHGLEPRTPYLDPSFVEAYLSLDKETRFHPGSKQQEKHMIRQLIQEYDPSLLPAEVLFRRKEAFSDGVSSQKKSWYQMIQERVPEMGTMVYDKNPPTTPEQKYYRSIFETNYPGGGNLIPYFWMPRFTNAKDASARTLSIYS
jgi:asparagine synthase (glutamine-hydrolysing)